MHFLTGQAMPRRQFSHQDSVVKSGTASKREASGSSARVMGRPITR